MGRISKEQRLKTAEEIEEEQKIRLENTLEKIEELERSRCLWNDVQIQQECAMDECEDLRKFNARNELYPYGRLHNEEEMRIFKRLTKALEDDISVLDQIKEKEDLHRQLRDEERRLDADLEKARLTAVGLEEELKARKKKDLMIGLVNQINCKKLEKMEEAEMKHLEGEAQRKCWERENEEELERMTKGHKSKTCYRDQLDICMLQKLRRKMDDDAIDKAIIERTNKTRDELENKSDEKVNNRKKRIERQQMIADMIRTRQEITRNSEMEAEIKRIQRSIDQMDRDYMRRELEEQCTRKEIELKVKQGRENQIQTKRELQAIEATKDKLYFESDVRNLIGQMEKEKGGGSGRQKRLGYGHILRQQMCDNEQWRKELMSEKFKDGREMAQKECMRRKLIEDEMNKKFCELRLEVDKVQIKKIT